MQVALNHINIEYPIKIIWNGNSTILQISSFARCRPVGMDFGGFKGTVPPAERCDLVENKRSRRFRIFSTEVAILYRVSKKKTDTFHIQISL